MPEAPPVTIAEIPLMSMAGEPTQRPRRPARPVRPYPVKRGDAGVTSASACRGHLTLGGVSRAFSFTGARIEFCAGIAGVAEDVVLSYGVGDRSAQLVRLPRTALHE